VEREPALDAIVRALRRIDFHGEVFGQTVAVRLGLSESDIKALEMLVGGDPVTAGHLAEFLNLSTGAVTRVVDRLEQAGYVRRTADAADRRRVVVEIVPDRMAAIREALEPLGDAHADVVAGYSDQDLDLINGFLSKMADAQKARAEAVRGTPGNLPHPGVHSAPLGAISDARLLIRSGAWELTIGGGAQPGELFHARFDGKQPTVRVRDSTVVVAYKSGMRDIVDWRRRGALVALNTTVPWSVEVHGGLSKARANLAPVELRSFELSGGADRMHLDLGAPTGSVPVRLTGGAIALRIERPADVPVHLRIRGGAIHVQLDDQRLGSASDVDIETPGASQKEGRFEVEVTGGAHRVSVVRRSR
jgi:DNA-binding MarR family transcriptional regulator